ncbi:hypothetical protein [Lysobacter sp. CA199]|uniref:hypothetical protein n=1 Tax=Lysobacter sp. CA199 TaxID=3455608 RepID=UPI003F8D3645
MSLHADWFYDAGARTLLVRYRLRNGSAKRSLAVFDRGVYSDRAGAVFAPGAVGTARVQVEGDGVSLIHSPDTPASAHDPLASAALAVEVNAGAELADQFVHRFSDTAPKRLRWCVGVMAFDQAAFGHPVKTEHGTVWTATVDTASARKLLCTPWYDVAAGRFAD